MFWKTGIREYKKFFEDENTRIREYKTLVFSEYENTGIREYKTLLLSCLHVFLSPCLLNSIVLSPCLLVFMSSSIILKNIRLVSLSSCLHVFFKLKLVRNSLVGLDGLDVGVERDGRLLNLRPHVVGHVLRVVAHVVREDDVVSALLQ